MKFLPLVWQQPAAPQGAHHASPLLSIVVAFLLFGLPDGDPHGVRAGRRRRRRRSADGHPQGLASSSCCRSPTRTRIAHGARACKRGHPRHLVRRHLPGPEELLRRRWRSSRRPTWRSIPSSSCRRSRSKAWLADRQGAIVGRDTAERFGWKIGDQHPAPGARSGASRRRRHLGIQHRRHLRRRQEGVDTTQLLLPLRLPRRKRARADTGTVGWYIIRIDDPSNARRRWRDASTPCSPTRRPRRRPRPRRRSPQGFAKQVGDIGAIITAILVGGLLHHPARGRQHHGAVGARADERARGAQDARLHQRPGARLVLAESLPAGACSAGGLGLAPRLADRLPAAIRPRGFLPVFYLPPRDLVLGVALAAAARPRDRRAAGLAGDAAAHRRRAAEGVTMGSCGGSPRSARSPLLNLRTIRQRRGSSAARSFGIAGWSWSSWRCCRSPRVSAPRSPRPARPTRPSCCAAAATPR